MSRIAPEQNALVTGAGSGIGRAIALALAREGMYVRLIGRDVAKLEQVATCAGHRARVLPVDLAAPDAIVRIADALEPELHVLVHSAGLYGRGPIGSVTAEDWRRLDQVNVYAPILLTTRCLPKLRAGSGQVVFVNSSAGLRTGPGTAAYAAGKHALRAAVDTLRQEVNVDGIRVLSVFPGRTETPMQRTVQEMEGRRVASDALMRAADVADMVMAALKLASSAEVTDIIMRPMRAG